MNTFGFEEGVNAGGHHRLGLVVLRSDETIEHDFRRLFPPERCSMFVSRIPSGDEVTETTLASMAGYMTAAAQLFPREMQFDVVGYGCTSGSAIIGVDQVADLVRAGCDARHVTNPLSALIAACRARGLARLSILSPYVEVVSDQIRLALADEGIETPVFGSFNIGVEAVVARIRPKSIFDAALALDQNAETDALFLSCTNLQTLDVIPELQRALGKPVFSSNAVLAWHMEHLAEVSPVN